MNWLLEQKSRNPTPDKCTLPLRFAEATFDKIPDGNLKSCGIEYLTNFYQVAPEGIGCLFLGKAGTYKTYTAAAMVRQIEKHFACLFVQCPVVLGRIERNRFNSDALLSKIMTTPFVVMDDFSQIPANSFGAGLLLEIAEERFSNLRPTVWTGNIYLAGSDYNGIINTISGQYGPSFGRRVVEASKGFGVMVK